MTTVQLRFALLVGLLHACQEDTPYQRTTAFEGVAADTSGTTSASVIPDGGGDDAGRPVEYGPRPAFCDLDAGESPPFSLPTAPTSFSIALRRGPCLGTCPVFEVAIDQGGQVRFYGERCVARFGPFSKQVSAADARVLYDAFAAADYGSYRVCYVNGRDGCPSTATDAPVSEWRVEVDGHVKSVARYHGCGGIDALARLDALEPLVQERAGIRTWLLPAAPGCAGSGSGFAIGTSYRLGSAARTIGMLELGTGGWRLTDCVGTEFANGTLIKEKERAILLAGTPKLVPMPFPGGAFRQEQSPILLPGIGEVGSIVIQPIPNGSELTARAQRAEDDVTLQLMSADGGRCEENRDGRRDTCLYGRKRYGLGESFPADDGCNTCSCTSEGVACTASGCAVTSCGGLVGTPCPTQQYCKYAQATQCGAADDTGTCTPIPDACDLVYSPLCGCDGKTYGNDCEAARAGVSIVHTGPC